MSEPAAVYHVIEWQGCYSDSWQHVITPDSFAHPAKFARGLIHRIYAHMIERGYIAAGDSVIDPFGGIAAGAYDALLFGLHWVGVELEERFCLLGNANIAKYRHDLRMLNGRLGTARLVQGDSRRLAEIVGGGVGAAVSSPPFEDSDNRGAAAMPDGYFVRADGRPFGEGPAIRATLGDTPGQLGSMRSGDFAAAVSSPPYADAVNGQGEGPGARHDPIYHNGDNAYKQSSANGYGQTPGNLGSMAGEGFGAAVSSPPYEAALTGKDDTEKRRQRLIEQGLGTGNRSFADGVVKGKSGGRVESAVSGYGSTPGNIGNDTGETFWSAARVIVEQTYSVLKPGGYTAWVTKRFVRNKQIVEFSDQWEALCEAVGFERVERIHALLVEDHGEQLDIFGGAVAKRTERKSFFQRLAEKKGSPRIDHEDVIIMRKPL